MSRKKEKETVRLIWILHLSQGHVHICKHCPINTGNEHNKQNNFKWNEWKVRIKTIKLQHIQKGEARTAYANGKWFDWWIFFLINSNGKKLIIVFQWKWMVQVICFLYTMLPCILCFLCSEMKFNFENFVLISKWDLPHNNMDMTNEWFYFIVVAFFFLFVYKCIQMSQNVNKLMQCAIFVVYSFAYTIHHTPHNRTENIDHWDH